MNSIQNIIQILFQTHDEIKKSIESNQYLATQQMLIQCQENAINMGNMIEEYEGEEFVTVSYIEQYCDALYDVYQEVDSKCANANKVFKYLKRQLLKVENSIKNDIYIKQEVVFLPYKASMWDSLESIWMAANEDPSCETYVIPVPYYDKDHHGSFCKMHYEGNEFPQYVPITNYESFDFVKHHPDIIYIHNPYDNYNYVTSVHPFFYTQNLKKFTDNLIYIPYFVLNEITPEDDATIEEIKHFCTVPGVYNSDRVIVQSESMRQVYIKVLTQEIGKNTEKIWKKKILGIGSPKFDKVVNTNKNDIEVPPDWLKKIQKTDGSWKKIIFYNTGISSLLENNEKMLIKIKSVLSIFKLNQDKVVLLWRPHPLIEATVSSMRPQLWIEYEKIVDQYREEDWGLYDDSVDVHRAIKLSDAYYGDASSIVQMYQITGKPLLMQNVVILDYETKLELSDAIKIDNEIWFYPFGKLFVLDIQSKQIKKYYEIPYSEEYSEFGRFSTMIYMNRTIYLIPYIDKKLLLFDIDSEKFTYIEINHKWIQNKQRLFRCANTYNKYLFMLGADIPIIVRLDTTNNSIHYICDWFEKIKDLIFNVDDVYFSQQSVLLDHKLFVPFCNANAVLELNCVTLETTIHKLGDENEGYCGICYSDGFMWLMPRNHGKLVKWNVVSNEISKLNISDGEKVYVGIVNQKNRKLILSRSRVKEKKGLGSITENIIELEGSYTFVHDDYNIQIYYENISGTLFLYDKIADRLDKLEVVVDWKYLGLYKILCDNKRMLRETRDINGLQLIETVLQREVIGNCDKYKDRTNYGKSIHVTNLKEAGKSRCV